MPLPFLQVPLYPNVPVAIGVPPVLRGLVNSALSAANQPVPQLFTDGPSVFGSQAPAQWGIADASGTLVLTGDSVFAVDYEKDYRTLDYPLQRGAFASYNKVETPALAKVTFSQGGSAADRQAFLEQVASLVGNTEEIFQIFTPEVNYTSVTLDHYDYRRTSSNGVTLLQVTVNCTQVRVTATTAFSNTLTPSGADAVNSGPVQATPVPASQGDIQLAAAAPIITDLNTNPPSLHIAGTAAALSVSPTLTGAYQAGSAAALRQIGVSSLLGATPGQIWSTAHIAAQVAALANLVGAH